MVFKLFKALKLLLKTTCNLGGIALFLLGENLFKTLFYLIDFQQNISYRLSHRICLSSRQKQKVFTCVVIIFHLLLSLWDQRSSLAGGAQVKVKTVKEFDWGCRDVKLKFQCLSHPNIVEIKEYVKISILCFD